MNARQRLSQAFHSVFQQNLARIKSSTDLLAAMFISLVLTGISPDKGLLGALLRWPTSISIEVAGGLLEDKIQAWRRRAKHPSFDDASREVERMSEDERQLLEALVVDLLPGLLDEVILPHREIITQEIRRQFEACKDHVSTEGVMAIQRLIDFIAAFHSPQYDRLLQELNAIKQLLEPFPNARGSLLGRSNRDSFSARVARKIEEAMKKELEDLFDDW